MTTIDVAERGLPLYRRLVRELRTQIGAGTFVSGDQLPSEDELRHRFKVSRVTVRHALQQLEHDGVLTKQQGRGSVIRGSAIAHDVSEFHTLAEVAADSGHPLEIELLSCERAIPTPTAAADLELDVDSHCVAIKRRYVIGGQPVCFAIMYVPEWFARLVQPRDFVSKTIYAICDELRLGAVEGRRLITAAFAEDDVARALGMPRGEPILVMRGRSRIVRGRPIESIAFYFQPERYWFRYEFRRGTAERRPAAADGGTRSATIEVTGRDGSLVAHSRVPR